MRDLILQWPAVLLRRWILTLAAGAGFLLAGLAVWLAVRDQMMLLLSGAVFILSLGRAALLFRCFVLGNYTVLEGVCIQVASVPLQKCRRVRLLSEGEEEISLYIDKRHTLQVGCRYRFYLQRQNAVPLPATWIAASLTTGNLLGVEEVEDNVENS